MSPIIKALSKLRDCLRGSSRQNETGKSDGEPWTLRGLCSRFVGEVRCLRLARWMRPAWSVLAVAFLIAAIAALIHFGPIQIWGWLLLAVALWCLKKFAGMA